MYSKYHHTLPGKCLDTLDLTLNDQNFPFFYPLDHKVVCIQI